MLEERSAKGEGGFWPPDGGGGGGASDSMFIALAAKTHPMIVPAMHNIWTHPKKRVISCMPINFGSFLFQRKAHLSTIFVEELSEGIDEPVTRVLSLGRSDIVTGEVRSAG